MKSEHATPSRLPSLGRRGEGWVAVQVILLGAAVAAGVLGAGWPGAARPWRLAAAGVLALLGAALFFGGGAGLGRQLTPFPKPPADGTLRQDGVFRFVRHPIYGGVLLLILAWSLISSPLVLVAVAVAAVFLDAKRRREEAWLVEKHPDYAAYRRRVRRSFIPFVW